jgi:GAF domain-containing protein
MADADVPELAAEVRAGRAVWATLEEMAPPTRDTFGGIDIQTTVAVPVFVDGVYAGVVGFDDCARRRPRQAHELDALETAARVVAAAIQRERLVDEVARERERAAEERAAALATVNAGLNCGTGC